MTIKKRDNIKDFFASNLSKLEVDAPHDMWEKLDKSLSHISPPVGLVSPSDKIKRIKIAAFFVAAAAVVALVVLINIQQQSDFNEPIIAKASNNLEQVTQGIAPTANLLAEEKKILRANVPGLVKVVTNIADTNIDKVEAVDYNGVVEELVLTENFDLEEKKQEAAENKTKQLSKKELDEAIALFEKMGHEANKLDKDSEKDKGKIVLGVGGRSGLMALAEPPTLVDVYDVNKEGFAFLKGAKEEPAKMEHRQPVSFGFTIGKSLNSRFSLETGIFYTYLFSRTESVPGADINIYDAQKFHYWGVPLLLNYRFASFHKAKFYLSAGGMVQKDFYGSIEEHRSIESLISTNASLKNRISQKNPQFSVMSTLGVAYPLYQKLHVFSTFGGAYFFDAKNEYNTIYSDKKTQFDINVGLRLDI